MKTISRYIMTLALLLTAVTGAWAGGLEGRTFVDFKIEFRENPYKVILPASGELPAGVLVDGTSYNGETHGVYGGTITVPVDGPVKFTIGACQFSQNEIGVKKDGEAFTTVNNQATCGESKGSFAKNVTYVYNGKAATLTFEFTGNTYIPYFFAEAVEGSIEVTWDAKAKSGTFVMPAFDVEIAPIYAPVAQWAKVEEVDQLPTAIEGIYAESTDAIVKAGTVAKIGETENLQGTLMYAVGTSATEQPALTAFSATLPTAKDITTAGDVYVWYYIKGADTPQGEDPTAENTFNDSEICAEPIKVTVLNNKFDIQFNAANANTIEAGKATVKVGETAAEVKEGKLTGVKMGSEVKVTTKEGYKFRKVEAKKKELPKYADVVTICKKNGDNKYLISSFFDGTNANITTITKEEAIALAEYLGGGNIFVVYEEYEISSYRYVRTTNAAGNVTSAWLSTTNTFNDPVYYVPAGN